MGISRRTDYQYKKKKSITYKNNQMGTVHI